jgi:hypothetical protein
VFYCLPETIQYCNEINKFRKEIKKFRKEIKKFRKKWKKFMLKNYQNFCFQRNSNSKAKITYWKCTQYFVLDFNFEFSWDHLQSHSSELWSHKKIVIEARLCRSVYRDRDGSKRIQVHDQSDTKYWLTLYVYVSVSDLSCALGVNIRPKHVHTLYSACNTLIYVE